jgi:hypothetical protein
MEEKCNTVNMFKDHATKRNYFADTKRKNDFIITNEFVKTHADQTKKSNKGLFSSKSLGNEISHYKRFFIEIYHESNVSKNGIEKLTKIKELYISNQA